MVGVDVGDDKEGYVVDTGEIAGSVHQFAAANGLGSEFKTADKTVQLVSPVDCVMLVFVYIDG
jgi:hypothetical protein